MENDLHQAFYGVFCSSREIIKKNQRHLYINMLDLLGRTCKATGLAEDKIGIDNLVQFWLADILPLIFDNDSAIQTCAVTALEQGLHFLGPSMIHKSRSWPDLRNVIVTELPDKIQKLRETKNKHWHQVWCFIITILDREILKGASVINSFLSIVELGFRSSDSNVRAEAFFCWRLLINIFTKYNELLTPKRLKLICIPLKSSQSKSSHSANVKARVWWYFITCINEKLDMYFDIAVEPFLAFVFGSTTRDTTGAVQQYPSLQTISVLCLAHLLLEEKDAYLTQLMGENNLETLNQQSPILNPKSLTKYWHPLINASFNAIRLLCDNEESAENFEMKQYLIKLFVVRIISIMLRLNNDSCSKTICDGLIQFLPVQPLPLKTALNYIASTGIANQTQLNNIESFSGVVNPLISLFIRSKPFVSPAILHGCIEQFTKIIQPPRNEQQWLELSTLMKTVTSSKDNDDYEVFEIRLLCWRHLARIILIYLRENNLNYRRKEFAEIVNGFILWPLNQITSFTGNMKSTCFDDEFFTLWRQLLLTGQNSPERSNFLDKIKNYLQELSKKNSKDLPLAEFVDAYIAGMMKLNCLKDSNNTIEVFKFLDDIFGQPQIATAKSFEQCLQTFRNFLFHLKNYELTSHLDIIKSVISNIMKIVSKEKCVNPKDFSDWKQGVIERFRAQSQKAPISEIREILNSGDLYVIIPSVWKLNPEKLTERQKERFAERSDIPALYNDMSQSQDSSIKPWTPNKIVIAKKDQTEIIIGSNDEKECVHNKKDNEENLVIERRNLRSVSKHNDNTIESNIKRRSSIKSTSVEKETNKSNFDTDEVLMNELSNKKNRKSMKNKTSDAEQKLEEKTLQHSNLNTTINASHEEINTEASKDIDFIEMKSDTPYNVLHKDLLCSQNTELSTEEKIGHPNIKINIEKPISEVQNENKANSQGGEVKLDMLDNNSTINVDPGSMEISLESKEVSPKKSNTKIISLSSPPDRKTTNNTCSPSLRPKPTPHLTRGAQLINMIRKKKVEGSSNYPTHTGSSRTSSSFTKVEKRDYLPTMDMNDFDASENVPTPVQNKDLLTFTKSLPSPSASPSVSILKRKLRRDSLDETPAESPASKRKRVSFHDPPVSITKEYVRDMEENQAKYKRCLALDKSTMGQADEIKHNPKRHSKLDSMTEIESCSEDPNRKYLTQTAPSQTDLTETSDYADSTMIRFNSEILPTPSVENAAKENPLDIKSALKIVVRECSLESVLESFFLADTTGLKSADILGKFLCKFMVTNSKVKTRILEILSENHSKDFLDHAIRENLSSVVCDRLNLNSIIEYICAKAKLNSSCRNSLLSEIPEIVKHSKVDGEPINFMKTVIENLNLSDGHILEFITLLMRFRSDRRSSSLAEMESTDVSSSNL